MKKNTVLKWISVVLASFFMGTAIEFSGMEVTDDVINAMENDGALDLIKNGRKVKTYRFVKKPQE